MTTVSKTAALIFMTAWPMVATADGGAGPFADPTGFALQSWVKHDTSGRPALYGATSQDANWMIAPMGGPGDFPPFVSAKASNTWTAGVPGVSVEVSRSSGGFTETLNQDGNAASCTTPAGVPEEFDFFIQPNGETSTYPSGNSTAYPSKKNFPRLAQLSSFTVNGTYTLNRASQPKPVSACMANHGNAGYGVTLIDEAAKPPQMFWYALQFSKLCNPISASKPGNDYLSCTAGSEHPHVIWYWTGEAKPLQHLSKDKNGNIVISHFAVSDVLPSFGLSPILDHSAHPLSLDLLSRLSALISSGKDGIDPDLSHWRIASVTWGQALWGDTYLSTSWQGFVPKWKVKSVP